MKIEIVNWEKYNPRNDVKRSSWFRMDHMLFFHPDYDRLSGEDILVWLYILSYASLKNSKIIAYDAEKIAEKARVKISNVKSAIQKFEELQCITVHDTQTLRARNVDVTCADRGRNVDVTWTCPTDGRTDDTNGTAEKEIPTNVGLQEEVLLKENNLPKIAQLWNAYANLDLSRIKSMSRSSARYKACIERFKEHPDEKYWIDIIARLNKSSFCNGDNPRGWKADIEFLTRPDVHAKLLEGKYDTRDPKTKKVITINLADLKHG